ncbi:MAG TPA: YMGG-like glycine zipper-containing protein, partial [Gemmatimonadota bacterium]|nr:YMGG-like glycine zipper-containing protein [Gemmatimonadota bacterium]
QAMATDTNPAQRVVYPAGDQSAEQQVADQLACYNWSSKQTGWNPEAAFAELKQDHAEAYADYQRAQGGMLRGAALGTLSGLAIGAIAGDAGKGAAIGAVAGGAGGGIRAQRQRQAAQAAFEAALTEFEIAFRLWDRHWMACMDGRDYSVR